MCSICGGTKWNRLSQHIWESSMDRGRDDHGRVVWADSWIGNHRGTPTTEVEQPIEKQPVGDNPWYVFNGIISNDKELGIKEGEADTSILPRILNTSSPYSFKQGIERIKGSYAIASLDDEGRILLGVNYKPIWILEHEGEFYFSSLKQHFPVELHPYKLEPYSIGILGDSDFYLPIPRIQKDSAIVICSSGLDSTSVASYVIETYDYTNVTLLYFDYGCLAGEREMDRIKKIALYLKCNYKILPVPNVFGKQSKILNGGEGISSGVEGAEYAHEWVPARNLVMLSLTTAYAESHNFGHIYLGTNLEEAGAFPDNEEQFILDFNSLLYGAVQNGIKIQVHTPLGGLMKHEVVKFGSRYGVPFHLTWSCYKDGEDHCGECAPCYMRKTAFERNGITDPVFQCKQN